MVLLEFGEIVDIAGEEYQPALDVCGRVWLCRWEVIAFTYLRGEGGGQLPGKKVLIPAFGPVSLSTRTDCLNPTNTPYIRAAQRVLRERDMLLRGVAW